MKRIYAMAAALSLFALAGAAQDVSLAPQMKMLGVRGAVMGRTVKGAPYSGTEVYETTQVLADGTRIHNETQTQVYRDGEGRVRRETGNDVTIFDPVANASYVLDAKTQTARKLPLGTYLFTSAANGKANVQYFRFSTGGGPSDAVRKLPPPDLAELKQTMADELKARVAKAEGRMIVIQQGQQTLSQGGTPQSLGRRMIEGVNSDGTRETTTIEAGAIGNDRPIQIVNERWYSPDLQTLMQSRHSDPRTGEETFKLTNVSRGEPPAYLFQVPAGYQITDKK
jgi:hypothetical protein